MKAISTWWNLNWWAYKGRITCCNVALENGLIMTICLWEWRRMMYRHWCNHHLLITKASRNSQVVWTKINKGLGKSTFIEALCYNLLSRTHAQTGVHWLNPSNAFHKLDVRPRLKGLGCNHKEISIQMIIIICRQNHTMRIAKYTTCASLHDKR